MATDYPLIDIGVITGIRHIMEAQGLPFADIAARAGLDAGRPERSTGFVSLNSVGLLFELAGEQARDQDLGLKVGLELPPGATGLLGHIMLSAPTVRDMLQAAVTYMAVYCRPLTCKFDESGGVATVSWTYSPQFTAPRRQYSLFALATLIMRIRQATGPSWTPLAVDCDFMTSPDTALLHKVAGPRINFQQSRMAIWVDPNALAMPMPKTMEGLDVSMRNLGDRVLAELGRQADHRAAVEEQLRQRLISGLSLGLEDIAADMGLTVRALQYRLEQEGTGFEAVLGGVRTAQAVHYLRDTDFSLAEIADKLGFSEASAFTRAIRNRFDVAPRDLRRQLREGKLPSQQAN